jgi:hypothetical protein
MARRHMYIPDLQAKPGAPTQHIDAAAQAIVEYKPDVLVLAGDFWDFPSLSRWAEKGSKEMENQRVWEDAYAGNDAIRRLLAPALARKEALKAGKRKQWDLRIIYTMGNHDERPARAASADPRLEGIVGPNLLEFPEGVEVFPYLEVVEVDGIRYSHYFSNINSSRPIGGSIDNRLNKIGESFVQGHEQGFLYGNRTFPTGKVKHGLVAGSFYMHDEEYKGAQGNGHWRGIVVLNGVKDGAYDIMPLSMDYVLRKFGTTG